LHPDAVWHPVLGPLLARAEYHGPDAIADLVLEEIPATIEGFTSDLQEVIERGNSAAIGVGSFKGRISSGTEAFEQQFAQVWRFRDGLAVEMRPYKTKREAMEATEDA
jgi:ketosteroid isomerase-like protein